MQHTKEGTEQKVKVKQSVDIRVSHFPQHFGKNYLSIFLISVRVCDKVQVLHLIHGYLIDCTKLGRMKKVSEMANTRTEPDIHK
jgi:hypothetical protein